YLKGKLHYFLLGKKVKGSVLRHLMELLKSGNSGLDGLEVCHHAAEPSCVYIMSVSSYSFLLDGVARLLLRTYKENLAAVCGNISYEHVSLIELLDCLLKVDDVNAVSFCENVGSHLRVPSSCLVSEVNACLKKLLH